MAFSVQEWLEANSRDEVLFLYKGEVSGSLITNSLDEIESKLEEVSPKVRKKIYNVLVECMQNLFHHSAILPQGNGISDSGKYGICILTKNKVGFHVITGNFVKQNQKDFLENHLSHINTLDKEALKNLYKEILDNQEFSEKGGGGLGMVDIARKSGNKLGFNFYQFKDDFHFFSLNINIVE